MITSSVEINAIVWQEPSDIVNPYNMNFDGGAARILLESLLIKSTKSEVVGVGNTTINIPSISIAMNIGFYNALRTY